MPDRGGVGDHAVNLLYAGAREIVSFDREPLAGPVQDLKLASVLGLDMDAFLRFWGEERMGSLDPALLDTGIRGHLGYGRDGWQRLLSMADELFTGYQSCRDWNPYLSSAEAYGKARDSILRSGMRRSDSGDVSGRCVHCDARDIPRAGFADGFDVIVLSNILEASVLGCQKVAQEFTWATSQHPLDLLYVTKPLTEGPLAGMVREIVQLLAERMNMNPGVRMMAGYFYRFKGDISRLASIFDVVPTCAVELLPCVPVCGEDADIAVLLRKSA